FRRVLFRSTSVTAGGGGYSDSRRIVVNRYDGIGGSQGVPQLTTSAKYPNSPDVTVYNPSAFEYLHPDADSHEGYGAQIIGMYIAPTTGSYQFGAAADDNCILYLSTDSDPANLVWMASVPDRSGHREYQEFG